MSMRFTAIVAALCAACLGVSTAQAQTYPHAQSYEDEPPPTRVHVGFLGGVAGLAPLSGYADRELGGGFEMGLYLAIDNALLISTLGIDQSFSGESDNRYFHVPMDAMFGYVLSETEITPYLAFGLGLHYLNEHVFVERTVGTVLRSTSHDVIEDRVFGLNLRLRAGLILWRTRTLSMMGALDYDVTFARFQERSSEQALRLSLALIVGGGNE